jgi:hypothetical protein
METTVLDLGDDEQIDFSELTRGSSRQTLILDCCRKRSPKMLLDEAVRAQEASEIAAERVDPRLCRRYYREAIEQCEDALVILYSCAEDELSGDDSGKGGVYSFNLLKMAESWAAEAEFDPATDVKLLSVVAAHNRARAEVIRIRNGRQTPQINKPRSYPYFPFCILA